MKDKKYNKVRYYCNYAGEYRSAVQTKCNLKYNVTKKSSVFFHNASIFDYHFIIKESAQQKNLKTIYLFRRKYITFTVPVAKEVNRIDKYREQITKNIS